MVVYWQPAKSNWHASVQLRPVKSVAPKLAHVLPSRSERSHASPVSRTPSPHTDGEPPPASSTRSTACSQSPTRSSMPATSPSVGHTPGPAFVSVAGNFSENLLAHFRK